MSGSNLDDAIRDGSLDDVRSIITADPCSVNWTDDAGNAPIHITLLCDISSPIKRAIATALISEGADVNAAGDYGWTPLHIAARRAEGTIAEDLIRAGALIDASDGFETPLDISLRTQDYYCVGLFLSYGASISIRSAVTFNRADWVRWILCDNPSAVRDWDRSDELLRDAIQVGNLEILRHLIVSGADINPSPSVGIHPLWKAAERQNIEAVQLLLEAGADPNGCRPQVPLPDWHYPSWSSPLSIAKERNSPEIQKLLKMFGATE